MENNDRIEIRHKRIELGEMIPLPAPFTLRIDPCGACNFKCVFCPCNQSDYKAGERHRKMSWEVFLCALDGMKEWASRDALERPGQELSLKVVDFHGFGEPLLNPLLPKMIRAVKDAGVCREVRLVTNGFLLTKDLSAKLIDSGLDLCRVSVYALEQDDYKRICGVDVNPARIVENISTYYDMSRNSGCRISAKIVSNALRSQEDVKHFHQIYDLITDYSFIEEIGEIWPDFEIGVGIDGQHIHGVEKAFCPYITKATKDRKICVFPFTEMQIHADGMVSPCGSDWTKHLAYGSIMEKSLDSLWKGERLKEQWRKHLDGSAYSDFVCRNCFVLSLDDISPFVDKIISRF